MKCPSQRRRILLPLLLAAPLACSEVAVTAVDVARVEIEPATPSLVAGQSMSLRATLRDGRGNALTGRTVAWQSSDPSTVVVDGDGLVTGLAVGVAQVTATVEGQQGTSTVTVLARPVAAVAIEPAALQLVVGQSASLSALAKAADGTTLADRAIEWSTENVAVATVGAAGLVTAVAPGSTRVLAISEGITGAAPVTVSPRPVATVQLTPAQLFLLQGDTARFVVVLRAADGTPLTGRVVRWRSEDGAVAQVETTGRIDAVGAGTTRVFALSEGVEGEGAVQVTLRPVASVSITPPSATITVGAGTQLEATLRGADGSTLSGRPIQWSSDAPGSAQVDATGRVTGMSAGTAAITATAEGVSGTSTILVQLAPVASVEVTPASASLAPAGVQQYGATLRAADGTVLTGRPITWTTSDAAVLTIDAKGFATAVAAGTATVTATADGISGQATATIAPTVVPVATVTVVPQTLTLRPGDTGALVAETRASDGSLLSGRVITWATSDGAVATVDANGDVSAVAVGNATITATSEGKSGTAAVTVAPPPPVPVAYVTVSPASATLATGEVQQFTATTTAADGSTLTGRAVTWTSSNPAVLLIDAQGRAGALVPGTATVTARSEGITGTASVTVTILPPKPVPVATVSVTPAGVRLQPGATQQFAATARDANGNIITGRAVAWNTASSAILTVTTQGLATAVAQGSSEVIATVDGVVGRVGVTVDPPPPPPPAATVRIMPAFALLRRGNDLQLQVEVRAADGTLLQKPVSWDSSDSKIANVTASGLVKPKRTGTVTITATVDGETGRALIVILP